jgi:hypothetical protein
VQRFVARTRRHRKLQTQRASVGALRIGNETFSGTTRLLDRVLCRTRFDQRSKKGGPKQAVGGGLAGLGLQTDAPAMRTEGLLRPAPQRGVRLPRSGTHQGHRTLGHGVDTQPVLVPRHAFEQVDVHCRRDAFGFQQRTRVVGQHHALSKGQLHHMIRQGLHPRRWKRPAVVAGLTRVWVHVVRAIPRFHLDLFLRLGQ